MKAVSAKKYKIKLKEEEKCVEDGIELKYMLNSIFYSFMLFSIASSSLSSVYLLSSSTMNKVKVWEEASGCLRNYGKWKVTC